MMCIRCFLDRLNVSETTNPTKKLEVIESNDALHSESRVSLKPALGVQVHKTMRLRYSSSTKANCILFSRSFSMHQQNYVACSHVIFLYEYLSKFKTFTHSDCTKLGVSHIRKSILLFITD